MKATRRSFLGGSIFASLAAFIPFKSWWKNDESASHAIEALPEKYPTIKQGRFYFNNTRGYVAYNVKVDGVVGQPGPVYDFAVQHLIADPNQNRLVITNPVISAHSIRSCSGSQARLSSFIGELVGADYIYFEHYDKQQDKIVTWKFVYPQLNVARDQVRWFDEEDQVWKEWAEQVQFTCVMGYEENGTHVELEEQEGKPARFWDDTKSVFGETA